MRADLLASETAREVHLFAVRPDKAVRDAMHAAYHEPVVVKPAAPVMVQGAHDAGSETTPQ